MPEQRRKFGAQMVIETGKPLAEVARDLCPLGHGCNWMKAWRHPRQREGRNVAAQWPLPRGCRLACREQWCLFDSHVIRR
jgi:hypothetical protein